MIHYRLRCADGHEFEGWFRGSAAFDSQAQSGFLSCPHCGTARVERALMAPAVRTRASAPPAEAAPAASPEPANTPAVPLPDELRAVLQRVRAHVEANCENMGDGFGAEALRIHRGEAPVRGIYGNSSEAEREALAEEGVEVVRVPWVSRADG